LSTDWIARTNSSMAASIEIEPAARVQTFLHQDDVDSDQQLIHGDGVIVVAVAGAHARRWLRSRGSSGKQALSAQCWQ